MYLAAPARGSASARISALASASVRATLVLALLLTAPRVHSQDPSDDYDYGDPSILYDTIRYDSGGGGGDKNELSSGHQKGGDYDYPMGKALAIVSSAGRLSSSKEPLNMALPLCCPKGEVFDQVKCIHPPTDFHWTPKLDGAYKALLEYKGFPKCQTKRDYIQIFQQEVHFEITSTEAKVFLPFHIHLEALPRDEFCIAKVYDTAELSCEEFQTKIFTCLDEKKDETPLVVWTSVTFSHLFLLLTLLAYFCVSELRCLQGQYMICFLISLLIYNFCLLPGSTLPMDISDVSCIALGAVKYFFFCGVFLWFNTICFDVWWTMRNKQDVSGRRRFLCYSAYSWTVGAVLTTVVLVMPYMEDSAGGEASRSDPLKDNDYNTCKLKLQMNMILQIAQFISLILDLVFLIMASCSVCNYSKFGNGLPKCEATLCLKQGWKLFIIMFAHVINCLDSKIRPIPVPLSLYLFILLESSAIFGVFAYRRTILKKLCSKRVCRSECAANDEDVSLHEKGQLTVA